MSGETNPQNKRLYTFGPFRLDAGERRLYRESEPVSLPRKAFDLLLILVEDAGRLKTREELIAALWPKTIVEEQGLTQRMHALRRALGDEGEAAQYIETVRGIGYRFIAPVTVEGPAPEAAEPPPDSEVLSRRRLKPAIGVAAAVVILVAAGLIAWYFVTHPPGAGARSAHQPSIAVLPFENLSADPANAYFASGIQDEILTRLAAIGSLKVIARTSTARYASRPTDLRAVAHQLGVTTVLEGSVQRAGNEVHINVQLIDTRTLAHIWARSYDRRLTNVFGVEGEVAQEIASALSARLLPQEAARMSRAPTHDPQAYLLFLKANYLDYQVFGTESVGDAPATLARAAALYRRAIAKDPDFALAYARLSILQGKNYWFYDHSPRTANDAERAAKRALALAPDLPQAHMAMGYAAYYGSRNYPLALAQFKQARENMPNNADVIAAIAFIQRRQGKWQQALAELRQVVELDRRNPFRHYAIATTLTALRRYSEADLQFRQALALAPRDYVAMTYQIWMLMQAGELKQAHRLLSKIPNGAGQQDFIFTLRFKLAWLERNPDAALTVLHDAPATLPGTVLPYHLPTSLLRAEVWALKGDHKQARESYEKARENSRALLRRKPEFPTPWSALGLAEAGLGEKKEAIDAGKHATRLLPVSRDAFSGPAYLAALAMIYARLDEPEKAVRLLQRLLAMPAGAVISVPLLRLDPAWDPIRKDPRFQALLKK